ncbi:hypothetical protein B0T25DRAFT_189350 [Lasiosphaeria hispida]|uniref:Helicase n=1 Tax=Lasiosphaeria hispida TaxID=260671 RepID=A0AAJ0HHN0_9PEZI|nr:hypothetical protein B0T25DRAFT_189350 [Lasiosphaeria hispida]
MADLDRHQFQEWRTTLTPSKVDIVGDFGGRGLFAIQGEALLSYCLENASVDFGYGFQILHAVHAVEAFLAKLRERGSNFHVVWFEKEEGICSWAGASAQDSADYHKYRLARSVLIQHFASTSNSEEGISQFSFLFPGLRSETFSTYLDTHPLHFFLGSSYDVESQGDASGETPLRMLYRMASAGFCIAFIEDVEFKSSKAHLFMATSKGDIHPLKVDESASLSGRSQSVTDGLDRLTALEATKRLSTREIVTLQALSTVLSSEKENTETVSQQVAAVLVQLIILRHCGLPQRALPEQKLKADGSFVAKFSNAARDGLVQWFDGAFATSEWDAFDLFDGRLYLNVLARLSDGSITLPQQLSQEAAELAELLKATSGVDVFEKLPKGLQRTAPAKASTAAAPAPSTVLPFSHPVVDQYLKEVQLDASGTMSESSNAPRIFQELTHWHNAKKPVDPKYIPKPPGFWARKRNQKFMADTIAYSASLTGASGKNIEPESIVVRMNQTVEPAKPKSAQAQVQANKTVAEKASKKKAAPKSNKQKALEEVENLKLEKLKVLSQAVVASWAERCSEFEKELSVVKRYLKAEKYLAGLSTEHKKVVGSEVYLYLCRVLMQVQINNKTLKSAAPAILAMLWSKAAEGSKFPLTEEVHRQLSIISTTLRIPLEFAMLSNLVKRPLPFKTLAMGGRSALPPNTSPREFQLEYCGPYLERSFDSAPDPRVQFHPDAWQRKVLDAIDDNKSLLVVAPTSAGKTFISFYAMKKVLQSNDDDILVYVAPTKALVNQIAAEVQARFSKEYPYSGRSVWSIHTRDYRVNNPKGCQILVTVPDILQILLLSPANATGANPFSKRIKRIIFDEVHCIGQAEDGLIWEQLLLLAPCPIIALSATVANPLEFKSWLQDAQKVNGYDLEMIVHTSRYSDLRKFIHDPPQAITEFSGLSGVERLPFPGLDSESNESATFLFVHPIGGLIDKSQDTLQDASLEPRDCLSLWNYMSKHATDKYPISKSLSPEKALPDLIKKSDIVRWETALKEQLTVWMADPKSPFEAVRRDLRGKRTLQLAAAHASESDVHAKDPFVPSKSIFSLILDLRSSGALPAILFNYDRGSCEAIAQELLGTLRAAENKYRETTPAWISKMADYERWRKAREAAKAKGAKKPAARRRDDEDGGSKADQARDEASRDTSKWDSFNPEAPLPQFSFADTSKMSNFEFEERMRTMSPGSVPKQFIDALRRGLGVHHAGMNRQYRQVVEMLFRKGYLTVVVATGTLAMGINMPCKTVVFTGDSVFLTALNYRQASGRAGRRGFDLLGNVVFHDIHPHRALEIMSAKLPDLRGQFPTSVTLVLRLFILLHGTDNSDFAANAVKSLITQNRLYLGGPEAKMSITHHLRFSIDYLRRQHLLSDKGAPLNFSGLVGHLYYTENAVFAFHALLKEGYFHELCQDFSQATKQPDILLEMLVTLCHLFARIPCTKYQDKEWLESIHRSSSTVILPDLPPKALSILEKHNGQTLKIFNGYVSSYAGQHLAEAPDNELPFTKHKVQPASPVNVADILNSLPPTTSRSPFAALSGFTDEFKTIHELCETARAGVFLEESAIPYIPIAPKETNGVPWNAYLLDFYKHGDSETLARDNGVKKGDVWFRLKDFSLVLATIVTSLANFLDPNANGQEEDLVDGAEAEDAARDRAEEDAAAEEEGVGEAAKALEALKIKQAATAPITKKKKKVVADSWDDDEDAASSSEPDNWDEDSDDEGSATSKSAKGSGSASKTIGSTAGDSNVPSWDREDAQSLVKVHEAFSMLRDQFDEKFRKMWA